MSDVFDLIKQRYWTNANRVGSLILLAVKAGGNKEGAALQGEAADVLRSAVVFLHAAFEDALRTLARHRLGRADEAVLDAVQTAMGTRNQPYKFTLKELASHRGKTIDEFVDDTISVYLSTKSFSSTSEVSAFLPMIGLRVADFSDLYPHLSELMTRRHEIVHTADLDRHDAPEPRVLVADDAAALEVYASTVNAFVARLLGKLDAPARVNSPEHQAFVAKAEEELAERVETRKILAAAMAEKRNQ